MTDQRDIDTDKQDFVEVFLAAKRVEGCSEKTLKYYKATIDAMLKALDKPVKQIVTEDVRCYLTEYQENKKQAELQLTI